VRAAAAALSSARRPSWPVSSVMSTEARPEPASSQAEAGEAPAMPATTRALRGALLRGFQHLLPSCLFTLSIYCLLEFVRCLIE
jgi:hypothetical protein